MYLNENVARVARTKVCATPARRLGVDERRDAEQKDGFRSDLALTWDGAFDKHKPPATMELAIERVGDG